MFVCVHYMDGNNFINDDENGQLSCVIHSSPAAGSLSLQGCVDGISFSTTENAMVERQSSL